MESHTHGCVSFHTAFISPFYEDSEHCCCTDWTILITFCDHPHWFPLATSCIQTSEAHHLNKCEKCPDPRLILVHFSPSLIHLLSLLFLCTSLLSSLCHFYPHFLTPSWLLWPLNVSRWQDTTPIVIHPALSDHCVSALVNTDRPHPSLFQAVVPLNDLEGEGRLSVHRLTI